MKHVIAVLAACGLLGTLTAARGADAPAGAEVKALEGLWKVVALEANGKVAPADVLVGMRWAFKGGRVQTADRGQELGKDVSIKLDPTKEPKQIDLVSLVGTEQGTRLEGIYKLEKGRLTICLRDPTKAEKGRPTEFKADAEAGLAVISLERLKE